MINYSKQFLAQMKRVEKLRTQLEADEKKLQELCPHVNLDGSSTFPSSISFSDCKLCGLSSYDVGRKS